MKADVLATMLMFLLISLPALAVASGPAGEAGAAGDEPAVAPGAAAESGDGQAEGDEEGDDAPEPYKTTVKGSHSPGKDTTADATHIDGDKLRDSPRTSTLEALSQETADVYVPGRGLGIHGVASGASGGVTIRGLGGSPNSQVLVVEDGVPDYQGIFGHPIPDAYVPFLIDEVMVVKGGDSVLYGTNAMGGVIVITSRWRLQEGFELENDASYGSYGTIRENAAFLGKWGKWGAASAFHLLKTDGHRDGAGGSNVVGNLGGCYNFNQDLKLSIRNKVVNLKGGDPGPATHPYTDHWYDVWRDNLSLHLLYRHDRFKLRVTPYFTIGVHELYDGFHSHDYATGGNVETDVNIHRTLKLLLGLGAEYVNGKVENRIDRESQPVEGLTNYSFYNQITYKPVDALSLVIGSREMVNTTYGFVFLYKGGFKWNYYEGLYLRSRVTRNFRQPTIRELYLPFPTSNPDLRPEYSLNWDFEAGFESKHLDISASGYRTQADNMIKYFGSWPAAEVVNIDRIVVWGVEVRINLKKLGPLGLLATANCQDVGRYTRQNPKAKLDFILQLGHDFGAHAVDGSISGEWVHGLYMADYGRERIDDVFVMDATLRYLYHPGDRRFSLEPYVFLRNLLDNRYAYILDYTMPGFNVMVGLKVRI
jgi:outer membrane receptor protein involved in Fe transport